MRSKLPVTPKCTPSRKHSPGARCLVVGVFIAEECRWRQVCYGSDPNCGQTERLSSGPWNINPDSCYKYDFNTDTI